MKSDELVVAGLAGLALLSFAYKPNPAIAPPSTYEYTVNVSDFGCKWWQFIEDIPYALVLNNGESISINITYSVPQQLDISDIRFHNVAGSTEGYGRMYAYVNGLPALPTIGIVNTDIPMYIAFPQYPGYGTVFTTVWDTDDVRGNGTFRYTYVYEGTVPLYIKSLELYVTKKI